MNPENLVIKLCIEGTQAEFQGDVEMARILYQQAWEASMDEYEACIAAHYVAHLQKDPQACFYWNQIALQKANLVKDARAQEFYPSLYLNMGQSYEMLGQHLEARRYYDLAANLGVVHQEN